MTLNTKSAVALAKAMQAASALTHGDPVLAVIRARFVANAAPTGQFSSGSKALADSLERSEDLALRLHKIAPEATGTDLDKTLRTVHAYFREGITRSAAIALTPDIDAHAVALARDLPTRLTAVATDLATILAYLGDTPFQPNATKSLLDVTTVLISSEFKRTMRQANLPIDGTGTDHNPYGNAVMLACKGIRLGLVLGSTDLDGLDAQGAFVGVSAAHKAIDAGLVRCIGRPFDFATLASRSDLPAVYKATDYLGYAAVANTVFKLFGVAPASYWPVERNGSAAPVLAGILS